MNCAEEVEKAQSEYRVRGLFIATWTETEAEARDFLRMTEKWSVDRG